MIRNFPPSAVVTWRSKGGQAHMAEIDIGEIFQDELVRHNVSREEMADLPDGQYQDEPAIILEVNNRTVRVYMKAYIPTRRPQTPNEPNSDGKYDLLLVKTYTF